MISEELLEKYHIGNRDRYETEYDFYMTFLMQTDHIPLKIIERLVENMANATITNFITIYIDFIKAVRIEYKAVLECRKFARDEINRLEVSE